MLYFACTSTTLASHSPAFVRLSRSSAGTPHRLSALIDEGALSLSAASVVLLDVHPEVKGFTLLDHPNLKEDVFALLRDHLHGRIAAGSLKLALY